MVYRSGAVIRGVTPIRSTVASGAPRRHGTRESGHPAPRARGLAGPPCSSAFAAPCASRPPKCISAAHSLTVRQPASKCGCAAAGWR
eukprot:2396295-Prymnesium_polylepis.1